jgi:hypothetical protein
MKQILVLFFFAVVIAAMKPTPSVSQLTQDINESCKDICK